MARSKRSDSEEDREIRGSSDSGEGAVENSRRKDQGFKLDSWQQEVLEHQGNIALRAGRQVGKSTVIAMKAGTHAARNKNQSIMIISSTERQAYLLFSKVLGYLMDNYKSWIKTKKDKPTKSEIKLNNGSVIRCLPTGLDGIGIRGYTVDLLIADEAAFIPEDVWPAVTPMLATTGGDIILLSTPKGDMGYFYDRYHDEDFRTWHINAEEIAELREEPQRSRMLRHQEKEKRRLSELQYAQEYLGEFVHELRRIFSDELVKRCCILKRIQRDPKGDYYLGVDIARLGDDTTTYEIVRKVNENLLRQYESIVAKKKLTTDTYDRILDLDKLWNFRKIGIDAGAGSLGVGIFDWLIRRESPVKRKVVAINNLQKSLDSRSEKSRRILKEDLYDNLLALMESRRIELLDDDDLIEALRSIQYEYPKEESRKTTVKIFAPEHRHTDLVEGLIRAAWLANLRHLKCFIDWI